MLIKKIWTDFVKSFKRLREEFWTFLRGGGVELYQPPKDSNLFKKNNIRLKPHQISVVDIPRG